MRFGFKTAPQDTTWAAMRAVWEAGDDIDVFESGWTFDHFVPIFSDPRGPCLEGWVTLSALSTLCPRLRLGVLVTGIPYRHPAVLANMAATLDHVSDGRLELGVGAGWFELELDAYGIDLGTMTQRFDRLDEACEIIVSLFTRETTDFDGEHFRLRDARCEPKPLQRPHPPICIGGTGERRTLRAVARFAQHWNLPRTSTSEFVAKRAVLESHCVAIGRDVDEITTSTHLRLGPRGEIGPLLEQVAELDAAGLDLGIVRLDPPYEPAILERVADAIVQNHLN